jgi:Tfp pilus assembly protein PilF
LEALENRGSPVRDCSQDHFFQLGKLYADSGRYDEGLARLSAALKTDPTNVRAQTLMGTLYERKGDIARAREAYEQVIARDPRFVVATNNLAWFYSESAATRTRRSSWPRGPRKRRRMTHTSRTPSAGSSTSAASTSER